MSEKKSLIFSKNNEIVHSSYIIDETSIMCNKISINIVKDAFKNDTTQESILMNSNVNTIGESAFENCNELQIVEFVKDFSLLGSCINQSVSEESKNVKEIELVSSESLFVHYHAFKNCCRLHTVILPKMSKSKKIIIEKEAFLGCNELRTIVAYGDDVMIEEEAFKGCDAEKVVFVITSSNKNNSVARFARENGFRFIFCNSILI